MSNKYIVVVLDKHSKQNVIGILVNLDNSGFLLYNESVLLFTNEYYKNFLKDDYKDILRFNKVIMNLNDVKKNVIEYINNNKIDIEYTILSFDANSYFTTVNNTINVKKLMNEFKFNKKERLKVKRIYYANDLKRKNEYRRRLKNREFNPY